MEKKLYNFSYSPIQKSFCIDEYGKESIDEISPLLISFETSTKENVWFNLWNTEGRYYGFIELSDINFKSCLEYIVELIENY